MKLRRKTVWGGRLALAVAFLLFASAPLRAQPRAISRDTHRSAPSRKLGWFRFIPMTSTPQLYRIRARILFVNDSFDARTCDRLYRPKLTDIEALRILVERQGNMNDPLVVDAFIDRCHTWTDNPYQRARRYDFQKFLEPPFFIQERLLDASATWI
jgi:hypothetical protein